MIDVRDIDPFSLPSVALSDRSILPACMAIYFVITGADEVIYIGKACCLVDRWQKHHRLPQIEPIEGVRIAWIACDGMSATEQFRMEQEYIQRFRPRLNRVQLRFPLWNWKKQREERYRKNTVPWYGSEPASLLEVEAQKGL